MSHAHRCLPVFEAQSVDHPEETAGDVQEGIATELDVQASEIDQEDVHRWKSGMACCRFLWHCVVTYNTYNY